MQIVTALASKYESVGVVQITQGSCRLGFADMSYYSNEASCPDFYNQAIATIKSLPDVEAIYISSPFDEVLDDEYRQSFYELLTRLDGYNIIVLGPTPAAPINIGNCFVRKYGAFWPDEDLDCDFSVANEHFRKIEILRQLEKDFANVKFVDVTNVICPAHKCTMEPTPRLFMYVDNRHLTFLGADRVISALEDQLP